MIVWWGLAAAVAAGIYIFSDDDEETPAPAPTPSRPPILPSGTGAGGVAWRVVAYPPPGGVPADSPLAIFDFATKGKGFAAQVFHDGRWRYVPPPGYESAADAAQLAQLYLERVEAGLVGFDQLMDLEGRSS